MTHHRLLCGSSRLCRATCARPRRAWSAPSCGAYGPERSSRHNRCRSAGTRDGASSSESEARLPRRTLSTARSMIQGPTSLPLPLVTSVGPVNCCTEEDSINVSSRGIGTGALLPLVFNAADQPCPWDHCTFGNTTPRVKSTSSIRSATASDTRRPANAPSKTATCRCSGIASWSCQTCSVVGQNCSTCHCRHSQQQLSRSRCLQLLNLAIQLRFEVNQIVTRGLSISVPEQSQEFAVEPVPRPYGRKSLTPPIRLQPNRKRMEEQKGLIRFLLQNYSMSWHNRLGEEDRGTDNR